MKQRGKSWKANEIRLK